MDLKEFLATYNPNDEHKLITVDAAGDEYSQYSPFIQVNFGDYSVIINAIPIAGEDEARSYLDLDIHPFVRGEKAVASVFGMTSGQSHETQWETGFETEGRPAANLLVVMVGEQGKVL